MRYSTSDAVEIGDIVDDGGGKGPRCRVVVIIETGQVAPCFAAPDWAYLGRGVVLQDSEVFGLLHLEELTPNHVLVRRA